MGEQGSPPGGSLLEGGHSSIRGLLRPRSPSSGTGPAHQETTGAQAASDLGTRGPISHLPSHSSCAFSHSSRGSLGRPPQQQPPTSYGHCSSLQTLSKGSLVAPRHSAGGGAQESDVSLPRGGSGTKPRSQGAVLDSSAAVPWGDKTREISWAPKTGKSKLNPTDNILPGPSLSARGQPSHSGDRQNTDSGPQAPASIFSLPGRSQSR